MLDSVYCLKSHTDQGKALFIILSFVKDASSLIMNRIPSENEDSIIGELAVIDQSNYSGVYRNDSRIYLLNSQSFTSEHFYEFG